MIPPILVAPETIACSCFRPRASLPGRAALPLPFAALAAGASADGSIPARTGGFGDATCRECHWDNPLNEPSGELRLDGVPRSYTPGDRYVLTVTLTRPRLERAGHLPATDPRGRTCRPSRPRHLDARVDRSRREPCGDLPRHRQRVEADDSPLGDFIYAVEVRSSPPE